MERKKEHDVSRDYQLIFGRHPVMDAIRSGMAIDKVLLQQQIRGPFEKEIRNLTRQHQIPLQVVPKERLNKFTRGNHQGVIGLVSEITYQQIEDILPFLFEQEKNPLILILDRVTDVRNFGAIARSAECLGVHAIVIGRKGSAPVNALAMKTSAGALAHIPVCRVGSLVSTVEWLKLSGIRVLASALQAQKPLFETDLTGPIAIIMGAEGSGVNPLLLQEVNETFIIPQLGNTDSLNVSVATGVILYEIARQRMNG